MDFGCFVGWKGGVKQQLDCQKVQAKDY